MNYKTVYDILLNPNEIFTKQKFILNLKYQTKTGRNELLYQCITYMSVAKRIRIKCIYQGVM